MQTSNTRYFQHIPSTHLPIYQFKTAEIGLLYTPGLLWKVSLELMRDIECQTKNKQYTPDFIRFINRASEVLKIYQALINVKFNPTNITFYVNQKCNLNCQYCFSIKSPNPIAELSLKSAIAGLELVAENCRLANMPMTLAIHGGGEPLRSFHKVQMILKHLQSIIERDGLVVNKYIATNGVMPIQKAKWIAGHFDRIGISCDGPVGIQAVQRPAIDQCNTNQIIERTAAVIRDSGKTLDVRVTITPETIELQPLIAKYICENLKPVAIHAEPVYLGKRTSLSDCINQSQVKIFIDSFLQAQKLAQGYCSSWEISGTRLNGVHTSYCHLFQQVLNLVPGDTATACFKLVNEQEVFLRKFQLGSYRKGEKQFRLDTENHHDLISKYALPGKCEGCFMQYQCSHGCPNNCLLTHEYQDQTSCLILKGIAQARLNEASAHMKLGEMIQF
jgi:radical SAM protein with 4Fe4S-binding SPASM domain